ncbi:hypothetical protein AACH10_03465 [Ideonella sp. DXS22W]|uniref:Uncharacterized protein n=1 Tax=Pseudaquabacterium inlustre TaxID=2984192 RepID=A0ABU9CBP5_9BURK
MRNLVLLIVMVLAGGAGWWAGSWKGRDAIAALEKAKDLGEQAKKAHADETQALKARLDGIQAEFDAKQKARDAEFATAKGALDTALAGRDQTIAALQRSSDGKQTRIVEIEKRVADPTLPVVERNTLQAEITRLQGEVQAERARMAGLECSRVPVPAELLAPLRVGG